jgi:hypothetical protein
MWMSNRSRLFSLLSLLSLLPLWTTPSWAADGKGTLTLSLENDLFATSRDRHYTHGTEINFVSDTYVPHWFQTLAAWMPFYSTNDDTRFSWALGQQFFTPTNLQASALQTDDRPYAGWLYTSFGLLTDHHEQGRHVDSFELTLGTVGPDSGAESTQREVHEFIGSDVAQGWDNQLHNEVTVDISYDRQWMLPIIENHLDLVPHTGFMLGNSQRYIGAGFSLRIGSGLDADFGPPLIRPVTSAARYFKPSQPFFWYLFIGTHGRYVGHNIFLDGNNDGDSHSVDAREWVGDAQAGLIIGYQDWRVTMTHIARSREFEGQKETDKFGSLSISYRF